MGQSRVNTEYFITTEYSSGGSLLREGLNRSFLIWKFGSVSSGLNTSFSGSTVRIYIDDDLYWHIYKDGVLWWEPSVATNKPDLLLIGSESYSLNNATITGVRIY